MNRQDRFSTFYEDALAYLKFCMERKTDPAQVLNTLLHDIGGIIRKEICFLPRVTGYAKVEKKQKGGAK